MYKRLIIVFFFLSLLTSLFPVAGDSVKNTNPIKNPILQISNNSHESYFSPNVQEKKRIVFADTPPKFNYLLQNYKVIKAFPNLRAAIIEVSKQELSTITDLVGESFSVGKSKIQFQPIPLSKPSSPSLDSLEEVPIMGVDKLWDMGYTGQDVVVGVVDNGIQEDHPGLNGRILNQTWFEIPSYGSRNPYHGTAVAGTIVGTGDDDPLAVGNAYNSSIIAASWRMLDSGYFATGADDSLLFEALDYMLSLNQTLNIVNFSGSGPFWEPYAKIYERFDEANILLVSSAGNSGPDLETIGCPACYVTSLSVGAVDRDGVITSFSSAGPTPYPSLKPDVVSIGSDVYTTTLGGTYARWSGTSFSSPLTAGAIATLVSALNAENIGWNVGTLKAAVIRGANQNFMNFNYHRGAGAVDIYSSYLYLKSHLSNQSFASALAVTPLNSELFDLHYYPDFQTEIKGFTVVTSNSSDITMNLSGNISDVVSLNLSRWRNDLYSQFIPMDVNTTGVAPGNYSGSVSVTLGNETMVVNISLRVLPPPIGKVLMDLRHTNADLKGEAGYYGYGTKEMIEIFEEKGYYVEISYAPLTMELLSGYNALWIPDPVSIILDNYQNFSLAEIDAIHQYVNAGGSVLLVYHGIQKEVPGWEGYYGSFPDQINSLTESWGIHADTTPRKMDVIPGIISLKNSSSVIGGAEQIEFDGNYIYLNATQAQISGGYLQSLALEDNRTVLTTYDQAGAGRVLVTSSEVWLKNAPLRGITETSSVIGKNVVNWLLDNERLSIISEKQNESTYTVTFSSSITPVATRIGNNFVEELDIPITTNPNGTYTLTYKLDTDGVNEILVTAGSNYFRKVLSLDLLGPRITPLNENNTVYPFSTDFDFVKFTVLDSLYSVKRSDITVLLDGETPDPVLFPVFFDNKVLAVKLSLQNVTAGSHSLTIAAQDNTGHTSYLKFVFSREPEQTSSKLTSSSSSGSASTSQRSNFEIPLSTLGIVIVLRKRRR